MNPQIESFKVTQVLLEMRISTFEKYSWKNVKVWFSTQNGVRGEMCKSCITCFLVLQSLSNW